MSTPLSGEELAKRGLFSALIGIKSSKSSTPKTQSAQPVPNPWQNFDESEPCSTWQLQKNDYQRIQGPTRSLSQQLQNTFLASPVEQLNVAASPNDIFQEIVCECAPMEQNFNSPDTWFSSPTNFDINASQRPNEDPLVCPNCFHSVNLVPLSTIQNRVQINHEIPHYQHSNWQIEQLESDFIDRSPQPPKSVNQCRDLPGNISFEELIKAVVSAVKDSGIIKSTTNPATPILNESPEEVLRRKRQQNNEAAARYRRRQKEAKMTKGEEVEHLTERNHELRIQIDEIRKEMNKMRSLINNESKK